LAAKGITQDAPHRAFGWPLSPRPEVVRRFDQPLSRWSSGHRGVDLLATVGQPVLSAGDGIVAFSGSREPWCDHRSPRRRAAHDIRAWTSDWHWHGGPSRRNDRRDLPQPRTLRAQALPPLGRHLRPELPRSPVAAGSRPADSPATRLRP